MVKEKNFTVVKYAVKNKEIIDYGSFILKIYTIRKTQKRILNHINTIVN